MERTGFNPQKIYDALAQIIADRHDVEIKVTVRRKDEAQADKRKEAQAG